MPEHRVGFAGYSSISESGFGAETVPRWKLLCLEACVLRSFLEQDSRDESFGRLMSRYEETTTAIRLQGVRLRTGTKRKELVLRYCNKGKAG